MNTGGGTKGLCHQLSRVVIKNALSLNQALNIGLFEKREKCTFAKTGDKLTKLLIILAHCINSAPFNISDKSTDFFNNAVANLVYLILVDGEKINNPEKTADIHHRLAYAVNPKEIFYGKKQGEKPLHDIQGFTI